MISIERSNDSPGIGATYRQKLKGPGGRPIDGDYEVDEYDRPNRLAFSVTAGPARPHGVFEFAPDGDGTRVTFTLDLTPKGAMKLMAGAIQKQMDSEVAALDNVPALFA